MEPVCTCVDSKWSAHALKAVEGTFLHNSSQQLKVEKPILLFVFLALPKDPYMVAIGFAPL